jgi:transcriptional regulator with XRE-family HTH domain
MRGSAAWIRVKRALSPEALAVDAGVDRSCVGRIERGVENPTVETLDRLAAALEVVVAELLLAPKHGEKPPATLQKGVRRSEGRLDSGECMQQRLGLAERLDRFLACCGFFGREPRFTFPWAELP